jgi:F-type H+-transporting ATPase subunit a
MDEVFQKISRLKLAEFTFGGFTFELSNTLLCVWIVAAVLMGLGFLAARNLKPRPGRGQMALEMFVGFIRDMCGDNIGERHYGRFVPYVGTLFLFLCLSNTLSAFNFIPGVDLYSPTKDINVTIPLALLTILIVLFSSLRFKGPLGTAKDLFKPVAVMFPFKVLEYLTKPLSLCLRLFGNIVAAFLIMELIFHYLAPFAAPFSAYFDFFDGLLQAYIFTFLTCLYIGEAVQDEE